MPNVVEIYTVQGAKTPVLGKKEKKWKARIFDILAKKTREKWPIWVPFFACESENVPSPSSSNAVHSEIFIWLVFSSGRRFQVQFWGLLIAL